MKEAGAAHGYRGSIVGEGDGSTKSGTEVRRGQPAARKDSGSGATHYFVQDVLVPCREDETAQEVGSAVQESTAATKRTATLDKRTMPNGMSGLHLPTAAGLVGGAGAATVGGGPGDGGNGGGDAGAAGGRFGTVDVDRRWVRNDGDTKGASGSVVPGEDTYTWGKQGKGRGSGQVKHPEFALVTGRHRTVSDRSVELGRSVQFRWWTCAEPRDPGGTSPQDM